MNKLETICEILALKRSRAEREVAQSKLALQELDKRLETMKDKLNYVVSDLSSGAKSDDPVGDAIILEHWRDRTLGNIRELQIQKTHIGTQLNIEKQRLKEIYVKEDIVNGTLKVSRHRHEQDRLEQESSARLENWIVSRSCSS